MVVLSCHLMSLAHRFGSGGTRFEERVPPRLRPNRYGLGCAGSVAIAAPPPREPRAFQPVEPVRAQQDEMNQQCQHEQEREQRDQRPARIEEKPNSPHVFSLLCETAMRNLEHSSYSKPRPPLPHQEMRDDRDHRENNEARHEDPVKLLASLRQPRERASSFIRHTFHLHEPCGRQPRALSRDRKSLRFAVPPRPPFRPKCFGRILRVHRASGASGGHRVFAARGRSRVDRRPAPRRAPRIRFGAIAQSLGGGDAHQHRLGGHELIEAPASPRRPRQLPVQARRASPRHCPSRSPAAGC